MATQTLAQLRTRVRQRADMENSTFIADSELNTYINQSILELYDLLVQKFGNDYYVTSQNITIVNGTDSYALDATFLKLLGVDLQLTSQDYVTLKQFEFSERNRYSTNLLRGVLGSSYYRYRLRGSNLVLAPVPSDGGTIRVWYVPQPTALSADGDTFDGINGWEDYVVVDAAMKCKDKEESDVRVLMAQKEALKKRIEEAAGNRDAGFSPRIVNTQRIEYEPFDEFM